jgi:hypothetical protein
MPSTRAATLLVLLAVACTPAEPPYLGSWQPDESQTDMTNVTMTYEAIDSITYQVTVDNQTFAMKTDGTENETPWGGTLAVRGLDSLSWESIVRMNGQVIGTDTMWLSADGQTLTSRSHRPDADGGSGATEMQMTRASGGPGLAGTWRGSSVSGSMMGELSFTALADSGLTIEYTGMGATCAPTFDGADAPAVSTMLGDDWSCAIATDEAGGLSLTWKRMGEPRYVSAYSVSADGDTLTEVSTASGINEPVTVVYTRKAESMP